MRNKVVDFGQYRQQKLEEIQLDLNENYLGTLTVAICDELISINKQLALLRNSRNGAMRIEYNYFNRAKDSLMTVIERINKHYFDNRDKDMTISFAQLDCVVGTVEFKLQSFILDKNEENSEYKNLCFLYKKILPIYEKHKDIIEKDKLNN